MVLSNIDIIRAITKWRTLHIRPLPSFELRKGTTYAKEYSPFGTDTIDFRLGRLWKMREDVFAPPFDSEKDSIKDYVNTYFEEVEYDAEGKYVMPPNSFMLATTHEWMFLPTGTEMRQQLLEDYPILGWLLQWQLLAWIVPFVEFVLALFGRRALTCRVEGKTRFARTCFEVHICAPILHNGHKGTVVLELRTTPIGQVLRHMQSICQLQFLELRTPPPENCGSVVGQEGANGC